MLRTKLLRSILTFHLDLGVLILISNFAAGKDTNTRVRARISGRLAKALCLNSINYVQSNKLQSTAIHGTKLANNDGDQPCAEFWWNSCNTESCVKYTCKPLPGPTPKADPSTSEEGGGGGIQVRRMRPLVKKRIIGGTDAFPNEFPFLVRFEQFRSTLCGGSILSQNWILTAAHCFNPPYDEFKKFKIFAGDHNRIVPEESEQMARISALLRHEGYDEDVGANDIALVRLLEPLTFNQFVQPIAISGGEYVATGNAIVTGWGYISPNSNEQATIAQKLTIPILDHEECVQAFDGVETITDGMMCAGYLGGEGGQDSCKGDSGGPLATKYENGSYLLVGIVSWGLDTHGCGSDKFPGVYTEVAKYHEWILKHVQNL